MTEPEPNYDDLFSFHNSDPLAKFEGNLTKKLVNYKKPDTTRSDEGDRDTFIVKGESLIGNYIRYNKIEGVERLINSEHFDDELIKGDNLLLKLFTPNQENETVNTLKIKILFLLLSKIKEEIFVKWLNEEEKKVLRNATDKTFGYNWTFGNIELKDILNPTKLTERNNLREKIKKKENTCSEKSCTMDHKHNWLNFFLCCFKPKNSGGKKKSKKYIKNKQKTKHRRSKNKSKTYRKHRSL